MIADLTKSKQLIYSGPVNSLMRRVQLSLTATAVGSFVGSPILLHYFTSGWSFGSQLFFICSMGGFSLAQAMIGHSQVKKYVMQMYRLMPDSQSLITEDKVGTGADRIELVTLDLFGRSRRRIVPVSMLGTSPDHPDHWTLGSSGSRRELFYVAAPVFIKETDYFKRIVEGMTPK